MHYRKSLFLFAFLTNSISFASTLPSGLYLGVQMGLEKLQSTHNYTPYTSSSFRTKMKSLSNLTGAHIGLLIPMQTSPLDMGLEAYFMKSSKTVSGSLYDQGLTWNGFFTATPKTIMGLALITNIHMDQKISYYLRLATEFKKMTFSYTLEAVSPTTVTQIKQSFVGVVPSIGASYDFTPQFFISGEVGLGMLSSKQYNISNETIYGSIPQAAYRPLDYRFQLKLSYKLPRTWFG